MIATWWGSDLHRASTRSRSLDSAMNLLMRASSRSESQPVVSPDISTGASLVGADPGCNKVSREDPLGEADGSLRGLQVHGTIIKEVEPRVHEEGGRGREGGSRRVPCGIRGESSLQGGEEPDKVRRPCEDGVPVRNDDEISGGHRLLPKGMNNDGAPVT